MVPTPEKIPIVNSSLWLCSNVFDGDDDGVSVTHLDPESADCARGRKGYTPLRGKAVVASGSKSLDRSKCEMKTRGVRARITISLLTCLPRLFAQRKGRGEPSRNESMEKGERGRRRVYGIVNVG